MNKPVFLMHSKCTLKQYYVQSIDYLLFEELHSHCILKSDCKSICLFSWFISCLLNMINKYPCEVSIINIIFTIVIINSWSIYYNGFEVAILHYEPALLWIHHNTTWPVVYYPYSKRDQVKRIFNRVALWQKTNPMKV